MRNLYVRSRLALAVFFLGVGVGSTRIPAQSIPSGVTPPVFRSASAIAIPECRGLGAAVVRVQFVIDVTGKPQNIKVVNAPGEKHSKCIVSMVEHSFFQPATRMGTPFAANVEFALTVNGTSK